jgi:hypothetical protein
MKNSHVLACNIRTVLIDAWDPLGVCGNANLNDEYDSYIPQIVAALQTKVDVKEIEDLLRMIEQDALGVTSPDERLSRSALLLSQLAARDVS